MEVMNMNTTKILVVVIHIQIEEVEFQKARCALEERAFHVARKSKLLEQNQRIDKRERV